MSTETVVDKSEPDVQSSIVNDFSIQIATINGSGSQSSNTVLMRAIFQMGVPVSGKNLFPSNIQGLPTWFTIRASKHSYIARKRDIDMLIAMNPQTAREAAARPGTGTTAATRSFRCRQGHKTGTHELRSDRQHSR